MRRHRRLLAVLTAFVVAGAVAVATPNAGAAQFLTALTWTGKQAMETGAPRQLEHSRASGYG